MSLKSSKNVETNVYELEISVDAAEFEAAVEKAYHKSKGKITIQGFRKGKAPRALIEKVYGEGVFYEDAFDIVYPDVVSAAIEEAKLDIVAAPYDIDVDKIGKDGLEFKLKVVVKPEVKLGKYKGIKAEKKAVKISANDVKTEIDKLLEQNARTVTVEKGAVKKNDIAVIDFEGFVDGVAFEGGKGENYELTIGSGQFIPGFEEQIIGHKANDEFDVNVKFPKEYTPELAEKDATFKVVLHEIKKKELPKLDDEFAKDVSEFDTLDELKKNIKEDLKKHAEEHAEADFTNDLLDKVADGIKAEIPAAMIDKQIDNDVDDFSYRLQSQGLNLEMYLKYTGMDNAAFRDSFKANAEKQVKLNLALDKIVKVEKLSADEKAVEAEYRKYADAYNMEVEKIKAAISVDALKGDLARAMAIDLIKSSATAGKATEKKTADKAEEKKPAAKKETAAKKPAAKKEADAEKKTPAKKPAAKKPATKKTEEAK